MALRLINTFPDEAPARLIMAGGETDRQRRAARGCAVRSRQGARHLGSERQRFPSGAAETARRLRAGTRRSAHPLTAQSRQADDVCMRHQPLNAVARLLHRLQPQQRRLRFDQSCRDARAAIRADQSADPAARGQTRA